MPQASEELRALFEDDGAAWSVLGDNFWDCRGVIRREDRSISPSKLQCQAIDYLCDEWDYEWEGPTFDEIVARLTVGKDIGSVPYKRLTVEESWI